MAAAILSTLSSERLLLETSIMSRVYRETERIDFINLYQPSEVIDGLLFT